MVVTKGMTKAASTRKLTPFSTFSVPESGVDAKAFTFQPWAPIVITFATTAPTTTLSFISSTQKGPPQETAFKPWIPKTVKKNMTLNSLQTGRRIQASALIPWTSPFQIVTNQIPRFQPPDVSVGRRHKKCLSV